METQENAGQEGMKDWRPKINKKTVMSDWKAFFPELGVVRANMLGRRVGPLLHGVHIQYGSGMRTYIPATFLLDELDGFTLGLSQRLLHPRTYAHEYWIMASTQASECTEAAQALRKHSVLQFESPVSSDAVMLAHDKYLQMTNSALALPVIKSAIRFCAWAGRLEDGERLLADLIKRLKLRIRDGSKTEEEAAAIETSLRLALSDPKSVRDAADAAFASGTLAKLPVVEVV